MKVFLYKKISTDAGDVATLDYPASNDSWASGWLTVYRYKADSMYKDITFRIPRHYIDNHSGVTPNGAIISDIPLNATLLYNINYDNDFQNNYVTLHLTIDALSSYIFELNNNKAYNGYNYVYNLFGPLEQLNGSLNIPYELAFKYRNEGKLERFMKVNETPSTAKYSTYKKFIIHHRVSTPEHWNTSLSETSVAPWLTAYGSYMGGTVVGGEVSRPNRVNSNNPLQLTGMINSWLGGDKYDGGEFDYIEYLPDLQLPLNNIINFGIKNPKSVSIGSNFTPSTEGIERWEGSNFLGIVGYMNIMPQNNERQLINYGPLDGNFTVTIGGMFTKAQTYSIPLYNQLPYSYHIEFRYYLNVNQDIELRVYAVPGANFDINSVSIYQTAEYSDGFKLLQAIPITGLRIPYFIDPGTKEIVTTLNRLNFNPVAFLMVHVLQSMIDIFGDGFGALFDKVIDLVNSLIKSIDSNYTGITLRWSDIVKVVNGKETIQVDQISSQAVVFGVIGYIIYNMFSKLDLTQMGELIPGLGGLVGGVGDSVIAIFKSIGGIFAATLGSYLTMGVKTMFNYLNKAGYISDLGANEQEPMSDYVGFGSSNNPFTLSVSSPQFADISTSENAKQIQTLDIPIKGTTSFSNFLMGYYYLYTGFSPYRTRLNYGITIKDISPNGLSIPTINLPEYVSVEGKRLINEVGAKFYFKGH